MMDYFLSGGEVVAGLIALVAWWFALRLLGRLRGDRELSALLRAMRLFSLVGRGLHSDHERHRAHVI